MSAFKHALAARDAHIRTLHIALVALFLLALGMGFGCTAPHASSRYTCRRTSAPPASVRGGKCRPPRCTPSRFQYFSRLTAGRPTARSIIPVTSAP